MNTTMETPTIPNLALASNAATVAWTTGGKPATGLFYGALVAVLLGAISVVAALGVLACDRSGTPWTMAVLDATHSVAVPSSQAVVRDDSRHR